MEQYAITGGNALSGVVDVQTAKNAILPIMAGALLTDEPVTLCRTPHIADVESMACILRCLGCRVDRREDEMTIESRSADRYEIPQRLAHELRSSVFLLGSMLARFRQAQIAYPGGCEIGLRPIDLHLSGLKRLGVSIVEEGGYIICRCDKLVGNEVMLDCPSVGATENIMLAAVLAEGRTVIGNAAREPEIEDLQRFLCAIGGKVTGAGSGTIVIDGVKKLHGVAYTPIPDRIEAGTLLIATAMCGGEICIRGEVEQNICSLLHKLRENGCKIVAKNDKINISRKRLLFSVGTIETQPYPGFPTDLQAQMTALCCISRGRSVVTENLFETRFKYVSELRKMGADIVVKDRTAFICGIDHFHGATVSAPDLRGGASLILAALAAEGDSIVTDLRYVDRGYERLDEKLRSLGAKIQRVSC